MDALKLKRAPLRTAFTRAVNKLTELFEAEVKDYNEIETVYEQLSEKSIKLKEIDDAILQALIDDRCTEDAYSKEFDSIESYAEKLIFWKVKVKKILRNVPGGSGNANQNWPIIPEAKVASALRLPVISFQQFSGELTDWLRFWHQFKRIHEDEAIENADKFQYLIQATAPKSRAREIVESFPATADNYEKAVDYLKLRFGQEDILIQVYVRELLKLVLQNSEPRKINLASLYDKIEAQLRALETLGVTKEKYAAMLFPLVESSLPSELLRAFERYVGYTTEEAGKKDLDSLMKFLSIEVASEDRIKLARTSFSNDTFALKKKSSNSNSNVATATDLFNASNKDKKDFRVKNFNCIFCDKLHASENCTEAASLSFDYKKNAVMKKQACLICLKKGHIANVCRSKVRCIICNKRHLAVLCTKLPIRSSSEIKTDCPPVINSAEESNVLVNQNCSPEVLLQTLVVRLQNGNKKRNVRVILDSGCQKSYLLKSTAEEFGFKSEGEEELVHSLFGGIKTKLSTHKSYNICINNLDNTYSCKLNVFDQEIICNNVSNVKKGPWLSELKSKNISLTDVGPDMGEPIEILLGADVIGKLLTGQIISLKSGPVAIRTKLGWTLIGKTPINQRKPGENNFMNITSMFVQDVSISDLWKLETIGITDPAETKTKQEVYVETMNHFQNTLKIDSEGRYEVTLPWVLDKKVLSSNIKMAENRLVNTKKKLIELGKIDDYHAVFKNWLSEGIIEEVSDCKDTLVHYLPHRPVFKESSQTSKIRPVFDASAHSKGSPSLNDCLEKGPNLIEVIPTLLNRFRKFKIGVISDIEKAFLQISVREQDRDFLRFMWYDIENLNHIKTYRHRRVVFGISSSPFLLSATLKHHLDNAPENLRDTANILEKSFYVDNSITCFETVEELENFIVESKILLSSARFNLRGWQSNVPINYTKLPVLSEESSDSQAMVLGLIWDLKDDTLSCNINCQKAEDKPISKRALLSVANHVFDPVGFTAPVTLIPKLILQEVWKLKLNWDESLPEDLIVKFKKWLNQLTILATIKIPRSLNLSSDKSMQSSIHVFCDASHKAYSTCIFLRTETVDNVSVNLIQAKTRVAPLKRMTIPRLELMACCLGARMSKTVINDLELPDVRFFFWSDSMTALSWIQRDIQWGIFVYNRVKEIRELSDIANWTHVPSNQNPADVLSRGCNADQLIRQKWWEGPPWLYKDMREWPKTENECDEEAINSERRKTVLVNVSTKTENFDWHFEHFSSYKKVIRMMAWVFRFIKNVRKTDVNKSVDISCSEYEHAEREVIKIIQKEKFQGDSKEKLNVLRPITDDFGLLRATTRLSFREDAENFKSPIILPHDHYIVHLLIIKTHKELMHAGVSVIMTYLRENFLILKARRSIRQIVSKCIQCKRLSVQKTEVIPSSLPKDRVGNSKIFQTIGIDLAGPLYLKDKKKAWIVLFTCAVYRAVHLELITSLSTTAFLQSLRRFISRRGRPSIIYSDNGKNFVGANRALCNIDWNAVSSNAAMEKIQWKFNPPTAAWWGGFWERMIKMLKIILRKVLGRASLFYEELNTILCDCENVLNSRPLTYVSEDISDLTPLTPNMFLREIHNSEVNDIDTLDHKEINKRVRYIQRVRENLRKRFRIEYLGQLREQTQHCRKITPLKIGDIVLLENNFKKKAFWSLARVTELFPGKDGNVRVAKIKTDTGELIRPVQRLYNLELNAEEICVPPQEKTEIVHRSKIGRKRTVPDRLTYF